MHNQKSTKNCDTENLYHFDIYTRIILRPFTFLGQRLSAERHGEMEGGLDEFGLRLVVYLRATFLRTFDGLGLHGGVDASAIAWEYICVMFLMFLAAVAFSYSSNEG